MATKQTLLRYRAWYALLLRLYPAHHHDRFSEEMAQTFHDLLCERAAMQRNVVGYALSLALETTLVIVKENFMFMTTQNKRLIGILLTVAVLLLIPLVAMQYRTDVVWTLSDFIFAGVLLGGTGIAFELALRATNNNAYRVAFAMGLAGAFLLVWINGAVGIIGNENNPANLLYAAVLAVGFFGSIISFFKPKGMARTLFAAAIVQALVPVVALLIWSPTASFTAEAPGIIGVFVLNAFWVALFAGSGILFKRAALVATKN